MSSRSSSRRRGRCDSSSSLSSSSSWSSLTLAPCALAPPPWRRPRLPEGAPSCCRGAANPLDRVPAPPSGLPGAVSGASGLSRRSASCAGVPLRDAAVPIAGTTRRTSRRTRMSTPARRTSTGRQGSPAACIWMGSIAGSADADGLCFRCRSWESGAVSDRPSQIQLTVRSSPVECGRTVLRDARPPRCDRGGVWRPKTCKVLTCDATPREGRLVVIGEARPFRYPACERFKWTCCPRYLLPHVPIFHRRVQWTCRCLAPEWWWPICSLLQGGR